MRDSYQNLRLHTFVVNNIKNGNISKRPASISKQKTSFDNGENAEKFPVAPTSSIPGPILLSVAITELNVVAKSKLSAETINTDSPAIPAYAMK